MLKYEGKMRKNIHICKSVCKKMLKAHTDVKKYLRTVKHNTC